MHSTIAKHRPEDRLERFIRKPPKAFIGTAAVVAVLALLVNYDFLDTSHSLRYIFCLWALVGMVLTTGYFWLSFVKALRERTTSRSHLSLSLFLIAFVVFTGMLGAIVPHTLFKLVNHGYATRQPVESKDATLEKIVEERSGRDRKEGWKFYLVLDGQRAQFLTNIRPDIELDSARNYKVRLGLRPGFFGTYLVSDWRLYRRMDQ